jgi:hypothetical protein
MMEVGISGFPTEVWFGLLALRGTPTSIIENLNIAVNDAVRSSDMWIKLGQARSRGKERNAARFCHGFGQESTHLENRRTGIKSE